MPATQPYIAGWMYIPHRQLPDLDLIRHRLTVTPRAMAKNKRPVPVPVYTDSVPGYLGVPVDWGFAYLPDDEVIEDRTSLGVPVSSPRMPDPNHPNAPEGQAEFMEVLFDACTENHTVLAEAGTGTGKTVTALATAMRLGRSTIVSVHLERLANQWRDECKEKLGLTDDQIGWVQGGKCDYKGKVVTIALMKTLAVRDFDPEFYDYFGTAIWDEVHRCGTDLLSMTLGLFTASTKMALTATVKRKDGGDRIYGMYFGGVKVVSKQTPMECEILPLEFRTRARVWGADRQQQIMCLTRDKGRNKWLARILFNEWRAGRHVLGIGDSIDQIEAIMDYLFEMGVPQDDLGQYTGQYTDEEGKRKKFKKAHYEWVKRFPRIILGTYGTMKEGIDIPRLNSGVDLTPRSDFLQVIGRIRRTIPGKLAGRWYTPVDLAFPLFREYYRSRLKDVRGDPKVTIRVAA